MADQQFFGPMPLPPILSEIDKPHKWYLGTQLAKSAGAHANVDQYVQDFARGNSPEDIFNKQQMGIMTMFQEQEAQRTQGDIQGVAKGIKDPKELDALEQQMAQGGMGGMAPAKGMDGIEPGQPEYGGTPPMEPGYAPAPENTTVRDALARLGQARGGAPQYQEQGPPRINNIAMAIAALGAVFNPRQAQDLLAQPFIGAIMQRSEKAQEAQRKYMMAKDAHDAGLDQLKTELQMALGEQSREDRARERFTDQAIRGGERTESRQWDVEDRNAAKLDAIRKELRDERKALGISVLDAQSEVGRQYTSMAAQSGGEAAGNWARGWATKRAAALNEIYYDGRNVIQPDQLLSDLPTGKTLTEQANSNKRYQDLETETRNGNVPPEQRAAAAALIKQEFGKVVQPLMETPTERTKRESAETALASDKKLLAHLPIKLQNDIRASNQTAAKAKQDIERLQRENLDPDKAFRQKMAAEAIKSAALSKSLFAQRALYRAALAKPRGEGDTVVGVTDAKGNAVTSDTVNEWIDNLGAQITEQESLTKDYNRYLYPKKASSGLSTQAAEARDAVKSAFPGVRVDDAVVQRTVRGGTNPSDHSTGRALDIHADRKKGDSVAKYLIDNAGTLGVKYLIWNDRFWKPDGKGWRHEKDAGIKGLGLHRNHVHASFT